MRNSPDPAAHAKFKQIENGPADLARAQADAVAVGIALTDTSSPPPESENAAPLYLAWQEQKRGKIALPIYAEPMNLHYAYTPGQVARVQAIFSGNSALIALRDEAIARPKLYVKVDPRDAAASLAADSAIYVPAREAARELETQSYLLARSNDFPDAIASQSRVMRIARQLNTQPTAIRLLVSIAVEAIGLSGYQQLAVMAGLNKALDDAITQAVSANAPGPALKDAIVGDLPGALSGLETFRRLGPTSLSYFSDVSAGSGIQETRYTAASEAEFASRMIDASEALLIERVLKLAAASGEPPATRRGMFAQPLVPESTSAALQGGDTFFRIADMIPELYGPIADRDDAICADEQITLAAASLLAAKTTSGKFPDALPGSFPDPCSSGQLGYRREGEGGFVVYSAGKTGDFDGGKPGDSRRQHIGEQFFRYPYPTPVPVPKEDQ